MKRPDLRRRFRGYMAALILTTGTYSPTLFAADWDMALEQALSLDENGYTFLAITQLEALEEAYPEVLRLKLELASLYLKVDRPDLANQYISEVLADPDLPVKVRINAQMLQLDIQTHQTAKQPQWLYTMALTGGYEADQDSAYAQLSGAARLTRAMTTLDIGGRPLPTQGFFNAAGIFKKEFDSDDEPWLANLEMGLAAGTDRLRLSGGTGIQLSDEVNGPTLFLDNRWRPNTWTISLSDHWMYHDEGWNQNHRLGIQRDLTARWRLQGWGQLRRETNDDSDNEYRLGLRQTLLWQEWRWQSDLDYDLDSEAWGLETGLDWSLTKHWRLGTALGTEDLGQTDDNWHSEVSVRWTR